jgi:hypothetical protein
MLRLNGGPDYDPCNRKVVGSFFFSKEKETNILNKAIGSGKLKGASYHQTEGEKAEKALKT